MIQSFRRKAILTGSFFRKQQQQQQKQRRCSSSDDVRCSTGLVFHHRHPKRNQQRAVMMMSTKTTTTTTTTLLPVPSTRNRIHSPIKFRAAQPQDITLITHQPSDSIPIRRIRDLLNQRIVPFASFTKEHFAQADKLLSSLEQSDTTAESSALYHALSVRVAQEFAFTDHDDETNRAPSCVLDKPIYFEEYLKAWTNANINGREVSVAPHVLQKIYQFTKSTALIWHARHTILEAVIRFFPNADAAAFAESLVRHSITLAQDQLRQLEQNNNTEYQALLRKSSFERTLLMHAWRISKRPEANERITAHYLKLIRDGGTPDAKVYQLLLTTCKNSQTMEEYISRMKHQNIPLQIQHLTTILRMYAREKNSKKLLHYHQQISFPPENSESGDSKEMENCIVDIFGAYRQMYEQLSCQDSALACVRDLYQRLPTDMTTSEESTARQKIHTVLVDLMVRSGKLDEACTAAKKLIIPNQPCILLVKELAKQNRQDDATELLHHFIKHRRPTRNLFEAVIRAWAADSSQQQRPEAAERAFAIFKSLKDYDGDDAVRPDSSHFNAVLKCLSTCRDRDAGLTAQEVLDELEVRHYAGSDPHTKLEAVSFKYAVQACISAGDLMRAEQLLARKQEVGFPPGIELYNSILRHYGLKRQVWAAEKCDQLLYKLHKLSSSSRPISPSSKPNAETYELVMDSWIKCGEGESRRATKRIYELYLDALSRDIRLSEQWCIRLVDRLSNDGIQEDLTKAQKLLLEKERNEKNLELNYYIPIAQGWAKSKKPDLASSVLLKWVDRECSIYHSTWNPALEQTFEVLKILTEDCLTENENVNMSRKPDSASFRFMLSKLAKASGHHAADWMVAILAEVEPRHRPSNQRRIAELSFNLAIAACLQLGDLSSANMLMHRMLFSDTPPDVRTFSQFLKYFATLGTPEAAAEAENILLTMKVQTNTPPNVVAFGIAMNAWAKSGAHDSPARIWRLFQKLKEENLEPNPVIYTTIITFFSTTKDPKYLTLATDLLSEMENSNDEKMYLDFRQYVPVLQGWLDVQDAENAERVLLRWIGRSRTNPKVGSILPETYEKVLQCWLDLGDIEKATEFLERIDELYDSKILRYRTSKSSYEKLLVAWQLSSHPMGANEVRKLETKIGHIT